MSGDKVERMDLWEVTLRVAKGNLGPPVGSGVLTVEVVAQDAETASARAVWACRVVGPFDSVSVVRKPVPDV